MKTIASILVALTMISFAGAAQAQAQAQPQPQPQPKAQPQPQENAGEDALVFTPTVQAMVRFRHTEGKDFTSPEQTGASSDLNMVRQRLRIGIGASYEKMVGAFVQVQDIRTWGEEFNTLGDFVANGVDFHQGYGWYAPWEGVKIKFGRQEIALENHRLVGTVGWLEQARSFDGVALELGIKPIKAKAFYARVGDDDAKTLAADGTNVHAGGDKDAAGMAVRWSAHPAVNPVLIAVLDSNTATEHVRGTFGLLVDGKVKGAGISYAVEGYGQLGSAEALSHSGFMAAAKVRETLDVMTKPYIEAFFEVVSGDEDPMDDENTSFDTLFATNHKFYGEMDFYLNLPVHTQGRGLLDAGASIGATVVEGLKLSATYHYFGAAVEQSDGLTTFGHEVDLKIVWKPWKHASLDLVYAAMVPGEIFEAGRTDPRTEQFVYSTVSASF